MVCRMKGNKTDMEKLRNVCMKLIAVMGAFIFGYLTFHAWTSSGRIGAASEVVVHTGDHIWKNLLFTLGVLALGAGIGALADRLNDRALHVTAAVISLAVTVCCCFLARDAHVVPDADQIYTYEAAENFYSGDFTNIQTEWYFNVYPFQLGLGLLYGVIMRICGSDSYLVIQYAQAVCIGAAVYAAFRITLALFHSKKAAAVLLLSMSAFLPAYLYTLYLYGETFGVCFAMAGVLFWILAEREGNGRRSLACLYWILAALSLTVCYIARPALVIVPIAMAVIELLRLFSRKRAFSLIWIILAMLFMLTAQKLSVAYMEKKAGVELAEGAPPILHIAMGIQDAEDNETGPGSYNAYNLWLYYECGFDGKRASSEAFQDIKRTLVRWSRDPVYMMSYMSQKVLNQWNEATYAVFFMTSSQLEPEGWIRELYTGEAGDGWYAFLNLYQGTVYLMLFVYFLALFREKKELSVYLPGLILIGEFLFSMLWEAKSRYIYPYIVITLPCVAWSLILSGEVLTVKIRKIFKKVLAI